MTWIFLAVVLGTLGVAGLVAVAVAAARLTAAARSLSRKATEAHALFEPRWARLHALGGETGSPAAYDRA